MINEKLELFAKRYSCRSFTGELPDKDLLDGIALAAVMSPSGMNMQPWLINVITDKAFLDEMDEKAMQVMAAMEDKAMYERFVARGGKVFYNAPCMFLILKKPGTDLDCGIVSENIALAAAALGLGNVICGMARIPFESDMGGEYMKRAGFCDGYEFGMTVLVGIAAGSGSGHEPDLEKIRFL